ncbi:MAG: TIGR01212 family radical SAM protein [Salinivirgaceae bacterium]
MEKTFPWGHSRRYNDYPTYIKQKFGGRVQKISINVGFSCPNRDGTKGTGGCIYCDNTTFKPGYCGPEKTVSAQVQRGVEFFEDKYPDMRFMAYFQSYTNTYAPVDDLRQLYLEALEHPKVAGLIIGTRPDCVSTEIVQMLAEINRTVPVSVEFGLESTRNETLQRINRCHTWEESLAAIDLCHQQGIETGGHLILGLPGETEEIMLEHARVISRLPLKTLKLHQLQIIKNTPLARQYHANPDMVSLFTFETYIDLLIRFLEVLNPELILERFVSSSPVEKLIAPKWNKIKNFEVVAQVEKEMKKRATWQGRLFQQGS